MSVLVIGESANVGHCRYIDRPWSLNLALAIGCYSKGTARNKLLSLGLRWDAGLNMVAPGPPGNWDAPRAKKFARQYVEELNHRFDLIVMTGLKVKQAFDKDVDWLQLDDGWASLPHPSGRCRTWNSSEFTDRARDTIERWMYGRV